MIISRTPLRISFFGGGTDIPSFYQKDYGAVVGIGINKYVYVIVNPRFESDIRLSYSKTEIVKNPKEISHDLARESLLKFGIKSGIEIVTIADVPGSGTGLGSSGSTLVGMLNSLSCYVNDPLEKHELSESSCDIEINTLKQPIGKQDQYFAAYGGLSYFRFEPDGTVLRKKVDISKKNLQELESNILCFYTGISRNSSDILKKQENNIPKNFKILQKMRDQAENAIPILKKGDLTAFGTMLNDGWTLKKKMSNSVSNTVIDRYYDRALSSGALGGKISGAGGGGFLTLYCEPQYRENVRNALHPLKELEVGIDKYGSLIIKDS
jgi:D-glycero-alpha-D-manno-heptose-7-phosphate kinase